QSGQVPITERDAVRVLETEVYWRMQRADRTVDTGLGGRPHPQKRVVPNPRFRRSGPTSPPHPQLADHLTPIPGDDAPDGSNVTPTRARRGGVERSLILYRLWRNFLRRASVAHCVK